jgi:integrase
MAAQPGRCRGPRLSEDKRIAKSNNSTLCLTRPPKPERLSKTTAKPYEGFPLTPHPSGRWCKKIRGKLHYFGKLDDPNAALERLNREWPYLSDGRIPPEIDTGEGCTVRLLCNTFLTSKQLKFETGELSPRSFRDYFNTCAILVDQLGTDRRIDDLRPDEFEAFRKTLASTRGLVALKNEINRCRVVLKYAFDQRLIDRPVHFGQSFDRPSTKSLRKARHELGRKMFTFDEVTQILNALDGKSVAVPRKQESITPTADPAVKAMVLLGLNAGFGNTDVATLPQSAVDLVGGWLEFPRPKTGIHRRVPLWDETVGALKLAIAERPQPKLTADAGLVFLTVQGRPWVRIQAKRKPAQSSEVDSPELTGHSIVSLDALSQRFRKLLDLLGINSRKNFYTLRHNFETIAGESKDQVAVDCIMGHVDPSMAAQYRENVSDARLLAVVNVVRAWVFPNAPLELK